MTGQVSGFEARLVDVEREISETRKVIYGRQGEGGVLQRLVSIELKMTVIVWLAAIGALGILGSFGTLLWQTMTAHLAK